MRVLGFTSESLKDESRAWVVRLADSDVGPADHAAFDEWLEELPAHAPAYQRALEIYYSVEALKAEFAGQPHRRSGSYRPRRIRAVAAAVALGLAAAIAVVMFIPRNPLAPRAVPVATQTAEVRDVTLPDGSAIVLGARTRVELAFTPEERRVRLSDGEAFFDVAHDAERPFFVETPGAVIRVVGTQFDVKADVDAVRVAVSRGIVEVTEQSGVRGALGLNTPHRLEVGEQISISRLTSRTVESPAPPEPAAWRSGFLTYKDASLAEVVADANRYSETPIRIADSALADLRVTASYPTDRIAQMLSSLASALSLDVTHEPNGDIVLKPSRRKN